MKHLLAIMAALSLAETYSAAQTFSVAQKPVTTTTRHVDHRERIFSADQLWQESSLIAEVAIESSQPLDVQSGTHVSEYTVHTARVIEAFKPSNQVTSAGSSIQIRRVGGDRDRGDRIERIVEEGFQPFRPGEQYVLFLSELIADGHVFYSPITGPDGSLRVGAAGLQTEGRRSFSTELAGLGSGGLQQWLRNKRGGVR
jgi:hypothetical protein